MKFILSDPSSIQRIFGAGIKELNNAANSLGATAGVCGVGILIGEKVLTEFSPLNGDWSLVSSPDETWPDDEAKGVNYLGYAMGKMAFAIRTKSDSATSSIEALSYGESDSLGCAYFKEADHVLDDSDNLLELDFLAVFSGMDERADLDAAKVAIQRMRDEYKRIIIENQA